MEGNNTFVKVFLAIFFTIFICTWLVPILPIVIPFIKGLNPIWFVVIAVIILIIWIASSYNKLVHLSQKVNQSAGTIDVYLKQRFDLIPNLVETVKGYAKYEEKIAEIRAEYVNNNNQNMSVNAELNNRYNQLLAVVENYPELKSNENFLNLQKQLSKVESQLQAARRIYNSDVTVYNTKVHSVPSNIIASIFGFKEASLFEIQAHERENININI